MQNIIQWYRANWQRSCIGRRLSNRWNSSPINSCRSNSIGEIPINSSVGIALKNIRLKSPAFVCMGVFQQLLYLFSAFDSREKSKKTALSHRWRGFGGFGFDDATKDNNVSERFVKQTTCSDWYCRPTKQRRSVKRNPTQSEKLFRLRQPTLGA